MRTRGREQVRGRPKTGCTPQGPGGGWPRESRGPAKALAGSGLEGRPGCGPQQRHKASKKSLLFPSEGTVTPEAGDTESLHETPCFISVAAERKSPKTAGDMGPATRRHLQPSSYKLWCSACEGDKTRGELWVCNVCRF